MRFATIRSAQGPRAVLEKGGKLVDLQAYDKSLPSDLTELIERWEGLKASLDDISPDARGLEIDDVRFAAPIVAPEKIICIGLNYADHAIETGKEIPELPVVFNKFPTAIIGHREAIVLPTISEQVDYEAELVVVIGKTAKDVSREVALSHVFGYCCGHDVSARDWQIGRPGGQWLLGKTFDTFAPVGPFVVTAEEVGSPGKLNVKLRLNGTTMQDSNTQQFIFPIDYLVSHLSQFCTLKAGDLIFTGTPPGVGVARKPRVFLKDGDVVEVEIEKLGTLQNNVVQS